jgi:tRNA(Ile)-lysidine synthase
MHPRRGVVIRPLLDCRRSDLRRYLEERKVSFVRDTSNDDLRIPRNRVRAELIPFLERQFNPSIVDRLAEQAEIAREEWLWLKAAADNLMARICRREGERWVIDVQGLKQAPRALSRLVVHQVMTDAAAGATVPFAHVEESLALMDREAGRTDAPGQIVERVGTDLCFHPRPSGVIGRWRPKKLDRTASVGPVRYQLPIPGEIAVPELGRIVSVEEADGPSSMWGPALAGPEDQEINNRTAVIRRNSVTALTVRNRRAGDRFRPIGMKGTKKLQDFFVDRKVPREERDTVPLVVDAADRIVWVAGYALSEEFRVTDPAQAVIILRLKVLGGSA